MRKGEILGLRWEEVDLEAGRIILRKTKNRKVREVPMNERVLRTFSGIKREGPWIFLNPETGKNFQDVRPWFKNALEAAAKKILEDDPIGGEARKAAEKIRAFRFHDLRHTAITDMILGGIDVVTVGEIVGHSSIEITRRYCHPTGESRRRAVEVLGCLHALSEPETATQERHGKEG